MEKITQSLNQGLDQDLTNTLYQIKTKTHVLLVVQVQKEHYSIKLI